MENLTKLITERLLKEVGGQDILKDFGSDLLNLYLKIEKHYGENKTSRTVLPYLVANSLISVTTKLNKNTLKEGDDMDWVDDVEVFYNINHLPSFSDRNSYPSNKFLSELLGMSLDNFNEWLENPWEYEPKPGDPDLEWGESAEYIIKNNIGGSNGKWEFITSETGDVDIWDGSKIEEVYIYENKENFSFYRFVYIYYYDEDTWDEDLIEVFPIAEKIVFG